MFAHLKKVLVESFVGAIALGWIFAQSVFDLVGVITRPLDVWEQQKLMSALRIGEAGQLKFPYQASISPLIAAIVLTLVGLLLLRWLYYSPIPENPTAPEEPTLRMD